jgi:hypothetical protein
MLLSPFADRFTPESPLIFIHIPKTGGMSFAALLRDQFRFLDICDVYHGDVHKLQHSRARAILGHISRRDLEHFRRQGKIVTVLRNPIERVLSLYNYWRSLSDEEVDAQKATGPLLAKRMDMVDFLRLDDPLIRSNFYNAQALQLLPKRFLKRRDLERCPAGAVRSLRSYLHGMYAVGTLERLPELVEQLGLAPDSIPFINRTPDQLLQSKASYENLSLDVQKELHRLTALDYAAYEMATQRIGVHPQVRANRPWLDFFTPEHWRATKPRAA